MIELNGVSKFYGDVVALDGMDLHVERGRIHGIVGPSGAGKSTLVRVLTGLERPTSGTIRLAGEDITQLSETQLRQARRGLGMVFQHVHLLDSRTAADNIAYPLLIAGVPKSERRARVAELLDLVGLADRGGAYPSQLSGGQQQRIGIARALAHGPDVLLCDEPTSALDATTTSAILELIRTIRATTGVTVLIITHAMSVVRQACDEVTLLSGGRAVDSGTLDVVVRDPDSYLSRALVPLPQVPEEVTDAVLDIFSTATPGRTDGAGVFTAVAQAGGDVTAGTIETLGSIQVARLAVTPTQGSVDTLESRLREAGLHVERRAR